MAQNLIFFPSTVNTVISSISSHLRHLFCRRRQPPDGRGPDTFRHRRLRRDSQKSGQSDKLSTQLRRLRRRQPLARQGLELRRRQRFAGLCQGVRQLRPDSRRPVCGRRLLAVADQPSPAVGDLGGSEEEAHSLGETHGAERWRA